MDRKHPVLIAAERRRAGRPVPPAPTPSAERIAAAIRAAAEPKARRSPKLCACCGARTAPLAQFHNQDTGYALCAPCADWIERREGAEYLATHYGRRGVHIEGKETTP